MVALKRYKSVGAQLRKLAPEKVVALARKGVAEALGEELPNYLNTLGIALYRTGHDSEAVEALQRSDEMSAKLITGPF